MNLAMAIGSILDPQQQLMPDADIQACTVFRRPIHPNELQTIAKSLGWFHLLQPTITMAMTLSKSKVQWIRALKRPFPCDKDFWISKRYRDSDEEAIYAQCIWKNPNLFWIEAPGEKFTWNLKIILENKIAFFEISRVELKTPRPIENSEAPVSPAARDFVQPKNFPNIYHAPETKPRRPGGLRPIILDASNIAMAHGKCKNFSAEGIMICMQYFLDRGHQVKAFLPSHRQRDIDKKILEKLLDKKQLIFTPSRIIDGKKICSYDDRYMLQYATLSGGIVVSNDYFRDLYKENPKWRATIKKRVLPFNWVTNNCLVFPSDPLGKRNGITLDQFLRFPGVQNRKRKRFGFRRRRN